MNAVASKGVTTKANRLLLNGAVAVSWVDNEKTIAAVEGDSRVHVVTWNHEDGWRCSCPARIVVCSHVLAVKTVCPRGSHE